MIDVEVAIVPIGTDSTSISNFIAQSEKALLKHPALNFKINGMATEIEGDNIDEIFDVMKEMHIAQIGQGAERVQTSIRIDDRRDKNTDLNQKIASVKAKI